MNDRLKSAFRFCQARRVLRGDKPPGYLYAVECQGFIKLGYATNPKLRLAGMQTGNPFPIRLIAKFPSWDMCADEKALHSEFRQYRFSGEWHKLPTDLIAALVARHDNLVGKHPA